MNVKFTISQKVIQAILENDGEMIIGEGEQYFPIQSDKEDKTAIEFFVNDILDEHGQMSILISKKDVEFDSNTLSTGWVSDRKKYILAIKSIKFRREGKDSL